MRVVWIWEMLIWMIEIDTLMLFFHFFFNDTATTEIYTLSLHDALPISLRIELGTSSTEGSALTNCATRLLLGSLNDVVVPPSDIIN